jgi:hypothetical protein
VQHLLFFNNPHLEAIFERCFESQSDYTQREKQNKTHHCDAQAILVMRRIPSARKTIQGPCRVFSRSRCEFRRHDEKEKKKKKRKETEGRVYIPRNQQLRSGEVDRCT